MDGTALYECVAVIFIAQIYGLTLGFDQQLIIVITSLLASIGAASVPMSGLVMMSIILSAVGLPLEAVGIILAVDRFLYMFRTATNVLSYSVGTVVIAKLQGEDVLEPRPEEVGKQTAPGCRGTVDHAVGEVLGHADRKQPEDLLDLHGGRDVLADAAVLGQVQPVAVRRLPGR